MNSYPDLKQLWQQQPAPEPDLASFMAFARAYRRKQSRKRWKANIMLSATVFFIGYILFQIDKLDWLMICGSVLVMLAVILYLLMYNRMFAALGKADYREDNRQYLEQLLVYQKRQQFMQRQGISGYFILLCTGLGLYMTPFIRRMPPFYAVISVALTAGWILFSWVYFRPRTIARETAALKAVIDNCEKVSRQWETPAEQD